MKLLKKPGLTIIILLLLVISFTSIKPQFHLLGWDNYSSYFNLKTNIFRTFFSTWREYRGLGVPSDAEATDIFRQLFFWIFQLAIPQQLLDQLYSLLSLWLGTLAMYASASLLLKDFGFKNSLRIKKSKDLFASIATLFYLFNLNSLSVFYSPIIPFTNRFYSLPLTLFVFLKFINSKKRGS